MPQITSEEIRQLRRDLDLTQDDLADRLGVRRGAVGHWETGRSKPGGPAQQLLRLYQAEATQRKQ